VLMSVVAPDEPEGYRGRRRRFLFPFTRKAGGAALPALLVAASIVVVLIVVGVSQLLPKQAAGQIPSGSGQGTVSDESGQLVGPDGSLLPTPGKSGKPGKPGAPKASGSASPGTTATPSGTPTPTPSEPQQSFAPMAVEAESASLGGAARTGPCTACSGTKVRFIGGNAGTVTFGGITSPKATTVQLTFWYLAATTARTMYISVNGGTATLTTPAATVDWNTPKSATVTVTLSAGTNSIKFYNPTASPAPDLDRISLH